MAKIPKEVEEIKEINRNRFQIEEYKALRREIEIYLHESRFQERYTIVASGLIWAWLITHRIDNGWVWSLPVWIALASSIRRLAITGHFNVMREYLKGVENFYGVKGWEHRDENLEPEYCILGIDHKCDSLCLVVCCLVLEGKINSPLAIAENSHSFGFSKYRVPDKI